jgi:flagellar FliJ protein
MKRFRFPLQAPATVREVAESRAREACAVAERERGRLAEQVAESGRRLSALREAVAATRTGAFFPREQVAFLEAWRFEGQRAAAAQQALQAADLVLARQREAWLVARRNLKAIQRLEQHARTRHRAAAEHEAQRAIEEIALRRRPLLSP